MKKALITGIDGQDGSYLAELLAEKGYDVHGTVWMPMASPGLYQYHVLDLSDPWGLQQIIKKVQPNEIYHLAAMSNERLSFDRAEYTMNVNGLLVLRMLEMIRQDSPRTRLFQAGTSELFGKVHTTPQNEETLFHPRSPYGVAKLYAYWSVVNYREAYGLYACNGILYNHESPRRGDLFVTKKIVRGVVKIQKGLQEKLILGNLDMQRDWGYAKDYVEAMWLMLQQDTSEDFVIASGQLVSVRRFVELAFNAVGIAIQWVGMGLQEKGIDLKTGKVCVEVSPEFYRPDEKIPLVGDASKAKAKLQWSPKTSVRELISIMVQHEEALL